MSEGIVIALISAASAFICAGIAAFGGIVVESLKNGKGLSVGMLGLLGFIGAGIGLLLGALFGAMLMRQPSQSPSIVIQPTTNVSSPTQLPSQGSVQVIQNLITENNNFENGTTKWEYDARHQSGISIKNGHSGQAICSRQNLQANEAKGWVGVQYATLFPVTPGQTYTFAGWLKWENATQFHVKIMWNDNPANWSTPLSIMDGNSNGWVFLQGSVTVPSGVTTARLALWHGVENDARNVPGGEFCADELVFGIQK